MPSQPANQPANLRVVRFATLDRLAPLSADWDRLSRGVPFRSWAWLSTWWRHYGDGTGPDRKTRLFTLGVFDQTGTLIGLAPWYLETSAAQGRVLRFLGTGEVCSDYLSVLSLPGWEDRVARALADWLTRAAPARADQPEPRDSDCWDLLELTGVDAEDRGVARLLEGLERRGNAVHRRAGPNCWRIELPEDWNHYLGRLSKGHRKQIRRAERALLGTGRLIVHTVWDLRDLARARQILVDLHQRRLRSLGEPGCFDSPRFTAFHGEVMPQLLRNGQLRLDWLELDGRPLAAEYHLTGSGVVYAYQSGINPDLLRHSPGGLGHMVTVRRAIEEGHRAFDFLCGDEPYKAHWRARPRPSLEVRVIPARAAARLRHGIWVTGTSLKEWIKSGLRLVEG